MISRIWHGYTARENSDAYETLLNTEIFTGIRDKKIKGFKEIQLFRRETEIGSEFITIMWFDSIESVKEFAGEDFEAAVVPHKARALLSRFDERSQHYNVITELKA